MWKLKGFHWFAIALIFVAFFRLIGWAIYLTNSATPLWALLLTPSFSSKDNKKR